MGKYNYNVFYVSPLVCLVLLALSSNSHAMDDPIGDLIQEEIKQPKATPPPQPSTKKEKQWVIVIDPGHGGKDTGAIGHRKVREKEVVLQISRRLAKLLKKELNADVVMTRNRDRFITLEGRDKVSVKKKADLFISIHANAAARKEANGIEIYYLNNATDEASSRLATRENRGSRKSLSDLKKILSTLIQTESTELSAILAEQIHHALKKRIDSRYKLERLYVKTALFYVLVGAQAPSVLIEVGFVTNPKEAKRLTQREYQEKLSQGVAEGVARYFKVLESRKVDL